jgi:hypothetical protein
VSNTDERGGRLPATDPASAADLAATRLAWHAVAELILAGPQFRRSGTIRLRVCPGGFGTVAEPHLRVDHTDLVADGQRLALDGGTPAELAAAIGVRAEAPTEVYAGGSGAGPDDRLAVSATAAGVLAGALAVGDAALRRFAPDVTPVLWPEHLDVSCTVDEVNYGVSLGDTYLAEPYAYVGPWQPRTGAFFNAPFGAVRPVRELATTDDVVAFFGEGREHAVGTC